MRLRSKRVARQAPWLRYLARPMALWALLALVGCGEAVQAQGASVDKLLSQAREQLSAKQFDQAEQSAQKVLDVKAGDPRGLYLRGLARVEREQFAAGREDLEAAQKADPLLAFAAGRKAEFESALREARDNSKAGSAPPDATAAKEGPVKSDAAPAAPTTTAPAAPAGIPSPSTGTGPAPSGPPAAAATAAGPANGPAASAPLAGPDADAVVAAVRSGGDLAIDLSGTKPPIIGPAQRTAILNELAPYRAKDLTVKLVVLKVGVDPVNEAKRIYEAAQLGNFNLVVVATPDKKVGAYNPTLSGAEAKQAIDKGLAADPKASYARRLITVLGALQPLVHAAAAPAPTQPPFEQQSRPAPPAPPTPPRPWWPWAVLGAAVVAGGGWALARRLAARAAVQRLAAGFEAARPGLLKAAEALAVLSAELRLRRDRGAEAAQRAAELAYFDALGMMQQAKPGEVADTARVERAVALLGEANGKVDQARTQLAGAPPRTGAESGVCFFSGRPLVDIRDSDLVEISYGDQRYLVLASPEVGEVLRRGGSPSVRTVNGQHWACDSRFEPDIDFYSDRLGREQRPTEAVRWNFVGSEAIFRTDGGRPDYRLTWPG